MPRVAPLRRLPSIPEHPPPPAPRYVAGDRVLVVMADGFRCVATVLACHRADGTPTLVARLPSGRLMPVGSDDARVLRRLS